jgi:hypothetical protein
MDYSLDLSKGFSPFTRICEIKGESRDSHTNELFSTLIHRNFSRHLPYIFAILEQVGKSTLTVVDGLSWLQERVIGDHSFLNPKTKVECKKAHFVAISAFNNKSTYLLAVSKNDPVPTLLNNLSALCTNDDNKIRSEAILRILQTIELSQLMRFQLLLKLAESGGINTEKIDELLGIMGLKKKETCDKIEQMFLKKKPLDAFIELGKKTIENADASQIQIGYAKYVLKYASEMDENSTSARVALADAIIKTHETKDFTYAEALYKRAISIDKSCLDAHEGLATLYLHGGGRVKIDVVKAKQHFQKVAEAVFNDASASKV